MQDDRCKALIMTDTIKSAPKNINQWLEYLDNINPNVMKLGLERVKSVAKTLGVDNFPNSKIVTVAGTNGKGSTATMLAKILDTAGINTGLYTSPHILRFSERIIVGGIEASDDELCSAFEQVYKAQSLAEPLTFFEFTTLAALLIFKEHDCQVIVLEVGLGGRLDAVNLLDADIVIIPSIGMDHCHILGNTYAQIATEKAGVIKPKTAVTIIGQMLKEAEDVIANKVYAYKGVLHKINKSIIVDWVTNRSFNLVKPFELKGVKVPVLPPVNAPLSLIAAVLLKMVFHFDITENDLRLGIAHAKLRGRFECIREKPQVIVDVAHNPPAAVYLHSCITNHDANDRNAVIGMLKDKNIAKTLETLAPDFTKIYACSLPSERGASKEMIKDALLKANFAEDKIELFDDVVDAYKKALAETPSYMDLYVFGSFLTVEAVLGYEQSSKKGSSLKANPKICTSTIS